MFFVPSSLLEYTDIRQHQKLSLPYFLFAAYCIPGIPNLQGIRSSLPVRLSGLIRPGWLLIFHLLNSYYHTPKLIQKAAPNVKNPIANIWTGSLSDLTSIACIISNALNPNANPKLMLIPSDLYIVQFRFA